MSEDETAKKKFKGEKDLEMTELEWLIDHHITKEDERKQMIEDLHFKPGDFVLDLGCGPGLWATMIADKVKPNGKVIGIDFSPCLLDYAEENVREDLADILEFRKCNFYNIPFDKETFDTVFFGNCLAYVDDHLKILEEIKRITKKGGKIIAKDFDGAVFIIYPAEPELCLKILTSAARSLKENPLSPVFDNFMGRKIHGLFYDAGIKDINTKTYAIQKFYPLSQEAKRYITGNAEWHAKIGSPYISKEDYNKWESYFDPISENYILDRREFYFCMIEVITEGKIEM